MSKLLFAASPPAETAPMTRIGGRPLAPRGFAWPRCKTCRGAMQFLAQVRLDEAGAGLGLLLVFMCQNDPGMCDDFAPGSGGNAAHVVPLEGLEVASPPSPGVVLLSRTDGVDLADEEGAGPDAYEEAVACGQHPAVLGRLGGSPFWLQNDETPRCECGRTMTFVLQLEEAAGGGINFGDAGTGYAFVCAACRKAKFLWQCG